MKIFCIADTHFYHENIIRFCNRPFRNVEEMNETMIKNWNETVSNKDTVIHLGDFGLGNRESLSKIVERLNGNKILILGNHDTLPTNAYRDMGFKEVSKFPIIYSNFYIMSHEPLLLSETTPYFLCFGHTHNDSKYIDNATSACFCVERIGYRPKLLFEKH